MPWSCHIIRNCLCESELPPTFSVIVAVLFHGRISLTILLHALFPIVLLIPPPLLARHARRRALRILHCHIRRWWFQRRGRYRRRQVRHRRRRWSIEDALLQFRSRDFASGGGGLEKRPIELGEGVRFRLCVFNDLMCGTVLARSSYKNYVREKRAAALSLFLPIEIRSGGAYHVSSVELEPLQRTHCLCGSLDVAEDDVRLAAHLHGL